MAARREKPNKTSEFAALFCFDATLSDNATVGGPSIYKAPEPALIEAFILAGGASRRMGTDKAQLLLDGETFTARIARTLQKFATRVTVVGQHSEYNGLTTIDDVFPEWGALGGLHAALNGCESKWAAVVACDLPFVTVELFVRMADLRNGFDAIIPVQGDGIPQPLCGLYRTIPCLKEAERLIHAGKRRPLDLLQAVNTRWVEFAEFNNLEHAEAFFVNINTPEDYYAATRNTANI
jgi:molybdopterin-guanine dinucleotide biosynthesis protein A